MWVLPSSRPGRAAPWLVVAFLAVVLLNYLLMEVLRVATPSIGPLHLLATAAVLLAVAALVAGVVALSRKDRALLVWLSLLPGLAVLALELGELLG